MNFFDRVQQLHALLRDRRTPISGQQLQEELECSRATLHRLIAKLRDELGAPILYEREPPGYRYRSDANFELPGLWFTPHELVALLTIERVLAETGPGWLGEQLSPLRERCATCWLMKPWACPTGATGCACSAKRRDRRGPRLPPWRRRWPGAGGSRCAIAPAVVRTRAASVSCRRSG